MVSSVKENLNALIEIAKQLPVGSDTTYSLREAISFSLCLGLFLEKRLHMPDTQKIPFESGSMTMIMEATSRMGDKVGCSLLKFSPPESFVEHSVELDTQTKILSLGNSLTIDDFPFLYEALFLADNKNKEGAIYTPPALAQRMIGEAITPILEKKGMEAIGQIKILDPACGAGIFLLEAGRFLYEKAKVAKIKISKREIFQNCLFGVDRDPKAIDLARILLLVEGADDAPVDTFPPQLTRNLHTADFLIDDQSFQPSHEKQQSLFSASDQRFSWQGCFPTVMQASGFDCVIGNPPYGLSRDAQIAEKENETLKELYSQYRTGKINKYMLFMARGFQLLNPQGVLSLVVPNSWLGIHSGKAIRNLFLSERCLDNVTVFSKPIFEDLGVEVVTFRVDKSHKKTEITIVQSQEITPSEKDSFFGLPYQVCEATPDMQIPVGWKPEVRAVLDKIHKNALLLGSADSPFLPMIALQAYAEGKGEPPQLAYDVENHVFHSSVKLSDDYYPYLEGGDIARFSVKWSGTYLRYGPWLAEPQTLDRFSGPRVVLREVLSPKPYILKAAFIDGIYLYNKSVLHILPKATIERSCFYALVAILNSKLASFVILQQGRKSQRKLFPKIVNDDLCDFPLPARFYDYATDLAEKAAMMTSNAFESLNEIDKLVYEAYGLNEEEIKAIEATLHH